MRRLCTLCALLAGLFAGAGGAGAQGSSAPPLIVYVDGAPVPHWFEAFKEGLRDLGYVENRSIVIERRVTAEPSTPLSATLAELIKSQPQVIVASGTLPALAAKKATTTIPIVVAFATAPVELGLVESLAHPGGNVTGLSNMGAGLMGKRLELLAEIRPGLSHVGVVWAPSALTNQIDLRELKAAASSLNLPLQSFEVMRPDQYDAAFAEAKARGLGVAVLSGAMAFSNREIIVAAAARHKVPAIYYDTEYARSGGLVSYGPSLLALHRRAALFVDRILKGTKPADIPVEEPTTLELAVNLRTARALGVEIPAAVLARADEVIE